MENKKNISIFLESKDIKIDRTDSGRLIDKVALAVDGRTEDDIYESAAEYETGSFDYIFEHFDFENALIDYFERLQFEALRFFCEDFSAGDYPKLKKEIDGSKLRAGAYLALTYPDKWRQSVKEFEELCDEYKYEYHDDGGELVKIAPALQKELSDSVDEYWKEQHREWLYGDYSSWAGIVRIFLRALSADGINYDKKTDTFTIDFTYEQAEDFISERADEGYKINNATLKREIVEFIEYKGEQNANEEAARVAKRREEWAKTKQYQDERKAQAEAERIEKLKSMKKTKSCKK